MSEEGKGFVIKDKRALDEKGELKEDVRKKDQEKPKNQEKQPPKQEAQTPPLPEVNFSSLIFTLSSSALYHIGELPDPQTGEKKKDLALAKHAIDTIAMLKEKTKGNLTKEEEKFIDTVLTDLRLKYVKAVG